MTADSSLLSSSSGSWKGRAGQGQKKWWKYPEMPWPWDNRSPAHTAQFRKKNTSKFTKSIKFLGLSLISLNNLTKPKAYLTHSWTILILALKDTFPSYFNFNGYLLVRVSYGIQKWDGKGGGGREGRQCHLRQILLWTVPLIYRMCF